MTRYSPSRSYLTAGIVALVLSAGSGWFALEWTSAAIAAALFFASATLFLYLAWRPPIAVGPDSLVIGKRTIPWAGIRRVDRTGWISPLVVHLTLADQSRVSLVYPGDLDSANSLLRHLRRSAASALIDGVPHAQFWGDTSPADQLRPGEPPPRYRVLREQDEEEVERLYQKLKTVGHLDSSNSNDEN